MLAASMPAEAQSPAARWISRWDRGECQLIRSVGDVERLSIKVTPGERVVVLWVRAEADTAPPQRTGLAGRMTLAPSGSLESSSVTRYRHDRGGAVYALAFPLDAALDALASSRSLQLSVGDVALLELPLGNIAAGVDVLRQCANDQLRSWGIDPSTLASLRQRPMPLHEYGLIGFLGDYPADALRRGVSGSPVIRLDVDAEGRVSACSVLQTSGDRALDTGTCRALQRRARFRPALDAAGRPTAAPFVAQVRWMLQD
jgi:TonB family protein